MALFPQEPTTNEIHNEGDISWKFDGTKWIKQSPIIHTDNVALLDPAYPTASLTANPRKLPIVPSDASSQFDVNRWFVDSLKEVDTHFDTSTGGFIAGIFVGDNEPTEKEDGTLWFDSSVNKQQLFVRRAATTNPDSHTWVTATNLTDVKDSIFENKTSIQALESGAIGGVLQLQYNLDTLENTISRGIYSRGRKFIVGDTTPAGQIIFTRADDTDAVNYEGVTKINLSKSTSSAFSDLLELPSEIRRGDRLLVQNVNDGDGATYLIRNVTEGVINGEGFWILTVIPANENATGKPASLGDPITVRIIRPVFAVSQATAPSFSVSGQLWHDTNDNTLKVWNQESGEFYGVEAKDYVNQTNLDLSQNAQDTTIKQNSDDIDVLENKVGTIEFKVVPATNATQGIMRLGQCPLGTNSPSLYPGQLFYNSASKVLLIQD